MFNNQLSGTKGRGGLTCVTRPFLSTGPISVSSVHEVTEHGVGRRPPGVLQCPQEPAPCPLLQLLEGLTAFRGLSHYLVS